MAISISVEAEHWTAQGADRRRLMVPDEVPLELRYNGTAYATMMVSPADLDDFVLGFSVSEAIIAHASAIKALRIDEAPGGLIAEVDLHGADYAALLRRGKLSGERTMPGRSGCGLCGVRTLDEARRALPKVVPAQPLSPEVIDRALAALSHAGMDRGVHGAALCTADGALVHLSQDVGRHNALDKLIGAVHRLSDPPDPGSGFCLLTSRCSYEMVVKAVRAGFSAVIAVSAPTGLALQIAKETGLQVAGLARRGESLLFTGPKTHLDERPRKAAP